jgi:hypothetical protein
VTELPQPGVERIDMAQALAVAMSHGARIDSPD